MSMKTKVAGMGYVVGGERKTWAGGRGQRDKGLHLAGARQHQSPNLSLGSKRRRNLKKEFFF